VNRSPALRALADEVTLCRACPRLVAHREHVAETKRRAYADETYWGRPVPGFGDPRARLLLVGLAPGAHGANRTGRAFTGDRSGDFLFAALHRAGLANRPDSVGKGDGLVLSGVFITLPVRCVPPGNAPTPDELARCRPFFDREIAALPSVASVLALGAVAWRAVVDGAAPPFSHGAEGRARASIGGGAPVVASYHVSQQNTQTGRLTEAMFDRTLLRAIGLAGLGRVQGRGHLAR
jgi:uracil-DNA glycosylase family 4